MASNPLNITLIEGALEQAREEKKRTNATTVDQYVTISSGEPASVGCFEYVAPKLPFRNPAKGIVVLSQGSFVPVEYAASYSVLDRIIAEADTAETAVGFRRDESSTSKRFEKLVSEWRKSVSSLHSGMEPFVHPAYQQIIGLGPAAVSLILERLRQGDDDHWFWALTAITGENPVAPEHAGVFDKMKQAWLNWGYENGVIA